MSNQPQPYFINSTSISTATISTNSVGGLITYVPDPNVVDEIKELAKWLYATLHNEHLTVGPHEPEECEVCEVLAEAAQVLE